jgi:hypothetical protein
MTSQMQECARKNRPGGLGPCTRRVFIRVCPIREIQLLYCSLGVAEIRTRPEISIT